MSTTATNDVSATVSISKSGSQTQKSATMDLTNTNSPIPTDTVSNGVSNSETMSSSLTASPTTSGSSTVDLSRSQSLSSTVDLSRSRTITDEYSVTNSQTVTLSDSLGTTTQEQTETVTLNQTTSIAVSATPRNHTSTVSLKISDSLTETFSQSIATRTKTQQLFSPEDSVIISSEFMLRINGTKWEVAVQRNVTYVLAIIRSIIAVRLGLPTFFVVVQNPRIGSLIVDVIVYRNGSYSMSDSVILAAFHIGPYRDANSSLTPPLNLTDLQIVYTNLTNSTEYVELVGSALLRGAPTSISLESWSCDTSTCIPAIIAGVSVGIIVIGGVVGIFLVRRRRRLAKREKALKSLRRWYDPTTTTMTPNGTPRAGTPHLQRSSTPRRSTQRRATPLGGAKRNGPLPPTHADLVDPFESDAFWFGNQVHRGTSPTAEDVEEPSAWPVGRATSPITSFAGGSDASEVQIATSTHLASQRNYLSSAVDNTSVQEDEDEAINKHHHERYHRDPFSDAPAEAMKSLPWYLQQPTNTTSRSSRERHHPFSSRSNATNIPVVDDVLTDEGLPAIGGHWWESSSSGSSNSNGSNNASKPHSQLCSDNTSVQEDEDEAINKHHHERYHRDPFSDAPAEAMKSLPWYLQQATNATSRSSRERHHPFSSRSNANNIPVVDDVLTDEGLPAISGHWWESSSSSSGSNNASKPQKEDHSPYYEEGVEAQGKRKPPPPPPPPPAAPAAVLEQYHAPFGRSAAIRRPSPSPPPRRTQPQQSPLPPPPTARKSAPLQTTLKSSSVIAAPMKKSTAAPSPPVQCSSGSSSRVLAPSIAKKVLQYEQRQDVPWYARPTSPTSAVVVASAPPAAKKKPQQQPLSKASASLVGPREAPVAQPLLPSEAAAPLSHRNGIPATGTKPLKLRVVIPPSHFDDDDYGGHHSKQGKTVFERRDSSSTMSSAASWGSRGDFDAMGLDDDIPLYKPPKAVAVARRSPPKSAPLAQQHRRSGIKSIASSVLPRVSTTTDTTTHHQHAKYDKNDGQWFHSAMGFDDPIELSADPSFLFSSGSGEDFAKDAGPLSKHHSDELLLSPRKEAPPLALASNSSSFLGMLPSRSRRVVLPADDVDVRVVTASAEREDDDDESSSSHASWGSIPILLSPYGSQHAPQLFPAMSGYSVQLPPALAAAQLSGRGHGHEEPSPIRHAVVEFGDAATEFLDNDPWNSALFDSLGNQRRANDGDDGGGFGDASL
ncbi:transmembrane protein, putative, partial [Bodo saltans]